MCRSSLTLLVNKQLTSEFHHTIRKISNLFNIDVRNSRYTVFQPCNYSLDEASSGLLHNMQCLITTVGNFVLKNDLVT
jgi:hypothetical protein